MLRQKYSSILRGFLSGICTRSLAALPSATEAPTGKPSLPEFDFAPRSYSGPTAEEVQLLRWSHISKTVFSFYMNPMMIVEGKRQYLFDEKGQRYLDGIAGMATVSVGHCHPTVVSATQKQQNILGHVSTAYLHPDLGLYAKELVSRFPDPLDHLYLVQSGSEANDLAMLLARCYTGNFDIIALRNAFHGTSVSTMGLTGMSNWKQQLPQGLGVHRVGVPNPYLGIHGDDLSKYIKELHEVIASCTPGRVAGFICEPIQGAGGSVTLLDGYLKEAYQVVRHAGGVCIADEVQTGFGRTGRNYWGFQNHDVVPDIVTMAEGIGNGVPLGAVVTTKEIADCLLSKMYSNSFGATPPIIAAARAVLKVIDEEGLQQNASNVGKIIKDGLRDLQTKHELIGDVRGEGLMLGVELVKDRSTKDPATAEAAEAMELLRDVGLLVGKGGMKGNVLRVNPPLCVSEEDGDFIVEAFSYVLSRL